MAQTGVTHATQPPFEVIESVAAVRQLSYAAVTLPVKVSQILVRWRRSAGCSMRPSCASSRPRSLSQFPTPWCNLRSQVHHVHVTGEHVRRSQDTSHLRPASGSRQSTFPALRDRSSRLRRRSGRSGHQNSASHSHRRPGCPRPLCLSTASTAGRGALPRHLEVADSGFRGERGRRAPCLGGGGGGKAGHCKGRGATERGWRGRAVGGTGCRLGRARRLPDRDPSLGPLARPRRRRPQGCGARGALPLSAEPPPPSLRPLPRGWSRTCWFGILWLWGRRRHGGETGPGCSLNGLAVFYS